jgi:hypothetical protein
MVSRAKRCCLLVIAAESLTAGSLENRDEGLGDNGLGTVCEYHGTCQYVIIESQSSTRTSSRQLPE